MNNNIKYSRPKEFQEFFTIIVREATGVLDEGDFRLFPPERELLRAQLVVDLIDKYGYSSETIEVGKLVEIDFQKKQFGEVDIVVYTTKRTPFMLINVVLPEFYQANLEKTVSLLFQMRMALGDKEAPASLISSQARNKVLASGASQVLIYYTGWHEKGEIKRKYLTIDCRKFQTFESWNAAGRPNENCIPSKNV